MRDCENCKHRVMKVEVGKGTSSEHFWGCECCECEFEPITKNNLGVDCISRKAALDITWQDPSYSDPLNVLTEVRDKIRELPPVTPQEPMVIPIAEVKIDEDKLRELADKAVLTVIPQEPILDKIWSIVYPLSIMSTDKSNHEAIMKITEMLEPLHWSEEEVNE